MEQSERDRHLETLTRTPERLEAALAGLPRPTLLWTPAPGKWSIQEIVCHMRDMERDAYLARYRRILAEDDPALPDVDGDAYALEGGYRGARLSGVVRDWTRLRKECLRLLKNVRGSTWQRAGTHETAGTISLEALVRRHAVGNDEAHLGQIEAIKTRFGLLSRLEAAPVTLAQATRGLSDEEARRRPSPEKWSIVEIACHLRDVERIFAERYTKIAHQDRPALWVMDNDRVAERLRYREASLPAVLKEWKRLRGDTVTLLRALPHARWQRTGMHPKRGEVSIEQLALIAASHDASHTARVAEIRRPDPPST